MSPDPRPCTVLDLLEMKAEGRRLVMLTCYDAAFARLLAEEVDILLVGDSLNQVIAGQETTLSATLDQMIYHAAAVRRGAPAHRWCSWTCRSSPIRSRVAEAIRNAGRVLQETGADGVKLEGGQVMAETVRALVDRGIPVMGHLGLTPQSVHALGGYRVQGRRRGRGRAAGGRRARPGGSRRVRLGARAAADRAWPGG